MAVKPVSDQSAPPEGLPFRRAYKLPPERRDDSVRFRIRLHRQFVEFIGYEGDDRYQIGKTIEAEHGIKLPRGPDGYFAFERFIETGELSDVLSVVTFTWRLLRKTSTKEADDWRAEVMRILAEENIGYRVDARGGVHYAVDATFTASTEALIAGLNDARFNAVRQHVKTGLSALDAQPPDYIGAIRGVFEGAEALFRQICPKASRLGRAELQQHLRPFVEGYDRSSPRTLRAANKLLDSNAAWVDCAHFYRHAEGEPDLHQPPMEQGIAIVGGGVTFIRWLLGLSAYVPAPSATERP